MRKGPPFADPEWLALAKQMAQEMVAAARNHPSVAIYSLGNECNTHNPEADAFFRQLAAVMREADSSRLLSYAALYGIVGSVADLVDVLGVNSYWGWYDRIGQERPLAGDSGNRDLAAREPIDLAAMRQMLDEVLARKSDVALLLTEFGADSVAGFCSRSRDLWSEDYHADLLQAILSWRRSIRRSPAPSPSASAIIAIPPRCRTATGTSGILKASCRTSEGRSWLIKRYMMYTP